jgi:glycolate oxidase
MIGRENVSGNLFDRIAYGADAQGPDIKKEKIPLAVVRPGSASETSRILEYANRKLIPVIIHGTGSVFKGGAHPKRPGSIVLNTARMKTLEIREGDYYFEAGAGVTQIDLERELAIRGYLLPMNTGSKYSATIGGAVAVNTIGHMVDAAVGKIIDYVMGVEAVLPGGAIIETGTKSIRRPAGLDLTRFFVGSEGLFGVITKVRIRLLPMPKKAYVVGFFKDVEQVAHAFMRIYKEKLPPPLYGELLGENTAVGAFKARGLGAPKGNMGLATTMGHTQKDADWQAEQILKVFLDEDAIEAHVVASEKEQNDLWEARDFILNMYQRELGEPKKARGGGFEMGVPLSRLAEFFQYIKSRPPEYPALSQAEIMFYGHIGACGPHVIWRLPVGAPLETVNQCVKESRKLEQEITVKWEGIGGEVGQMASRLSAWRRKYGEEAYRVALAIKKAFDPNNILNPGNLEGEGYED